MEKEYNLLTQRLLAEGHTADNHPDYVEVCRSAWGKELWQNLAGGFEYTREYRDKMVFKTGCGLLVEGGYFCTGYMSYMGIDWILENDNPTITCPYKKDECKLRNPVLGGPEGGGTAKILFCDCHQTDEPYTYEHSLKKANDDRNREIRRKYEEYSDKAEGHICHWHMYYDDWKEEWRQRFDPMVCAQKCMNMGRLCNLTHEPVSRKKGNVFYDVRTSYIRQDGTLFDGEEVVEVTKGVRLFDTNKSLSICENIVKMCQADIIRKENDRRHREMIVHGLKFEVLNIRAGQRESRDLMQDLQDIRDGIQVIHASDLTKQKKAEKSERRQQAKGKRIKAIEKRILDIGYENMEWMDQNRADKLLDTDRIEELGAMREENLRKEREKPVQLSIFDMM